MLNGWAARTDSPSADLNERWECLEAEDRVLRVELVAHRRRVEDRRRWRRGRLVRNRDAAYEEHVIA